MAAVHVLQTNPEPDLQAFKRAGGSGDSYERFLSWLARVKPLAEWVQGKGRTRVVGPASKQNFYDVCLALLEDNSLKPYLQCKRCHIYKMTSLITPSMDAVYGGSAARRSLLTALDKLKMEQISWATIKNLQNTTSLRGVCAALKAVPTVEMKALRRLLDPFASHACPRCHWPLTRAL